MSLTDAFSAPYPFIRDNGDTLAVPLLTMDQIVEFVTLLESRRNASLRKHAKEQKLSPESTANFVAIGEREEIAIGHLYDHANTIRGANEILAKVLPPEDLAKLTPAERRLCAQECVGWKQPKPKKKDEGEPANPSPASGPSNGS